MRWIISTSSPSPVGKSSRFARRSTPAKRRPSSAERGGSNVFSVAMCAGPAFSTGKALTGSLSARRHASTSGNSGNYAPSAMAEALRVAVRRGEFVECVHEVHAVAIREGETIVSAGDALLVASLRSAAKPLQALPLARAYPELDGEELAIAAASHYGTPRHVDAVRRLLAATGGSEDELDCGLQEGRPQEPIYDNCSGKHAGMIATCRAHGWPVEGYRLAGHPLQELLRAEVATAAGLEPVEVATGIDGCGVVAFAIPLERAALAYSRLEELEGGARVAAAMRGQPAGAAPRPCGDCDTARRPLPGLRAGARRQPSRRPSCDRVGPVKNVFRFWEFACNIRGRMRVSRGESLTPALVVSR